MMFEICEGCGVGKEKDYIYLYLNYLFLELLVECFSGILEIVAIFVGVDVIKELIFVIFIVYYNMGGILINYKGEVVVFKNGDLDVIVFGLFVVGEAACASVYGVNRLGVNLLFDIVVFGCVCVNMVVDKFKCGVLYCEIVSDVGLNVIECLDKI